MPLLRISEVVTNRAKLGIMDANYLWSYAPNIFDYQNSVITCDANGHTIDQQEENDT